MYSNQVWWLYLCENCDITFLSDQKKCHQMVACFGLHAFFETCDIENW